MVFLWRRRVFGPPFARGMARLLEVGEQALDRLLVRLVDKRGLAEPALLLAGLTGQDVTEVAAPPLHLARGGHLEALRRAPARLDLRHRRPFLLADQHDRHATAFHRSEEHTSELQSPSNLVCRLLLEKKERSPPSTQQDLGLRWCSARQSS